MVPESKNPFVRVTIRGLAYLIMALIATGFVLMFIDAIANDLVPFIRNIPNVLHLSR